MDAAVRERLVDLRNGLLSLHKTLLDSERDLYERDIQKISNSTQFLGLLLNDPWFAWLREISGFVAALDERLADRDQPTTQGDIDQTIQRIRALLIPDESGTGFRRRYFDAIQRDPDVVLAHGRLMKILSA